jgi:hypothetical protein
MDDNETPEIEWDELPNSTDSHELLRCTRRNETRTYSLREVGGGAELWRITEAPGADAQSVKEGHFKDSEQVLQFLEELRRSLIAGGWQQADV